MRRTKIVATLGPASDDLQTIVAMIEAGVDVARINLSHGDAAYYRYLVQTVRQAAEQANRPFTAILFDTRGPEIRVGKLQEDLALANGQAVLLWPEAAGPYDGPETTLIPVNYAGIAEAVAVDDRILLDDGNLALRVQRIEGRGVHAVVEFGGVLKPRKTVSLPRPPADLPSLTDEDKADLRLGVELGIDFVAASFVRSADDVIAVRKLIEQAGGDQAIIAKIENVSGVEHFEQIVDVADGIMVARGDLGVELPPEEVPILQKRFIAACIRLGKPVITATQMLESMVHNARPTRAEASDVANAILDGTDAIMLSAETAAGRFPLEAVRVMAQIAERTEEALGGETIFHRSDRVRQESVTDAISTAATVTARTLGADAILTATQSGHTARMVARHRPKPPIVAATPLSRVARQLNVVWGVRPVLVTGTQNTDEMIEETLAAAIRSGVVESGSLVVMTAGVPVGVTGTTNMLQVLTIGDVLVQGIGIGKKNVKGVARVARRPEALANFEAGEILVVPEVTRAWMPYVERAGGLIVEQGGLTSFGAVVAIDLGLPAVVGAKGALAAIADRSVVTIDVRTGRVYKGNVSVR